MLKRETMLKLSRFATAVLLLVMLGACNSRPGNAASAAAPSLDDARPAATQTGSLPHLDGERALQYVREVVAFGPRYAGSPGHAKVEAYLRKQLQGDNLQEDTFAAATPAGHMQMTNFIAKFPGSKDGIIVVAGHYDTLYNHRSFVGANDGGSSTALLLELARELRGKKLEGYSVWLIWFDGEEAIRHWSPSDSLYGSRYLAAKWERDGTLKKIQAFLLLDMVGDADLNIERDTNSTPWLLDVVYKAASQLGYAAYFYGRSQPIEDDHIPFARAGAPVADLIDFGYGPGNAYWHTPEDTLDKISARSLEIVGSVVLQTIQLLNQG